MPHFDALEYLGLRFTHEALILDVDKLVVIFVQLLCLDARTLLLLLSHGLVERHYIAALALLGPAADELACFADCIGSHTDAKRHAVFRHHRS